MNCGKKNWDAFQEKSRGLLGWMQGIKRREGGEHKGSCEHQQRSSGEGGFAKSRRRAFRQRVGRRRSWFRCCVSRSQNPPIDCESCPRTHGYSSKPGYRVWRVWGPGFAHATGAVDWKLWSRGWFRSLGRTIERLTGLTDQQIFFFFFEAMRRFTGW